MMPAATMPSVNDGKLMERTANEVIRLVSEDTDTRWEFQALVDSACERTGMKSKHIIANAVKGMIWCGFLKARRGSMNYESIRLNPDGSSAAADQMQGKLKELAQQLKEAQDSRAAADRAAAAAKDAAERRSSILEIIMQMPGGERVSHRGVFHSKFPKIVALAKARKNIFIYGPTGLGKSHICKQLAEVLGLDFAFIQCTSGMSEGQLGGRLLPVGDGGAFEYVISEFVRCYERGGVFLLDEIDAADPNVLLLVNAALANGKMAVPNRPDKPYAVRHPDFICIAAANTVGYGADRLYSGRNKLDAATLDRFQIGKVCLDYDEAVDRVLCPDDLLRGRLQRYRRAVLEHKMERAVSTRFMIDAYDMKVRAGWSDSEVDEALFAGWRADEVNKVKNYRSA
jgi:cobaltochelatase CobS